MWSWNRWDELGFIENTFVALPHFEKGQIVVRKVG